MTALRLILISIVLTATACTLLAFNEPGQYYLNKDGLAILKKGETKPYLTVGQLPDSIPPYLPQKRGMKFNNYKFHWLTESPDGKFLAFCCGDSNRYIGFINTEEHFLKWLVWGFRTDFLDATFSGSGKYIAYTYYSSDGRTKLMIVESPDNKTGKPKAMNTWFDNLRKNGLRFRSLGWEDPSDTIFSFEVVDSTNQVVLRADWPLHYNPDKIPEHMLKARKKPEDAIRIGE